MSDLLGFMSQTTPYPHSAGYQNTDTSKAAAESIPAHLLRAKVLREFERRGAMTADECASALHSSVLSIRPRVTELGKLGRLVATSERRTNASGRKAIVWRVAA